MLKPRFLYSVTLAVAAAIALSSCAGGTPTTEPTSSPAATTAAVFNDSDVTFAQMMLPHHEQSVEMSDDLLAKNDIDAEVRDLATAIKMAQEPEIAQLRDSLTQWGAQEHSMGGMNDDTGGMMSSDDMADLQYAAGIEASKLFLVQMTAHHRGAIEMAQFEIDNGKNADAQALAATIVKIQTDELAAMADLLASL